MRGIAKFFSFLVFFFFFLFFASTIRAEGEFVTDARVEYKVDASQKTTVLHTITLENVFSTMYATAYSVVLDNIKPQNVKAYDSNGALPLEVTAQGENTLLKVAFKDAVVGKGKTRTFNISYDEGSFAVRTGEVWEISIPRLGEPDSFRNYTVVLKVPSSFGQEAYVSPKPIGSTEDSGFRIYTFDKGSLSQTGISAGFGQFQVFSFTLNYHLENPLSKIAKTEIAIPPDTAFQKVYYQNASSKPDNVRVDEDGNWLALYTLNSRERKDISISGSVQIFSSPRTFQSVPQSVLNKNLAKQEFWEIDRPEIISLAQKLKTPKAIYDFVSTALTYDYQRVSPNVERLGAFTALSSPKSAICMEYTDLFVALARAAGIPAREINGYAYTENKNIQPIGLVADVLHAWPEYWDKDKNVWIPIDPTWASTTGGVDFFNKLDLRHFAFVMHGEDSTKPYPPGSYKLGVNPQKDVFVSFGQLPAQKTSYPNISTNVASSIPFTNSKILVEIENPGPIALYNLAPQVFFDNKFQKSFSIDALPPYAKYQAYIDVPFSFLGQGTPGKISVRLADKLVEVPTFKNQVIIDNLIVLFLLFTVFLTVLFVKIRKITLKSIADKFKKNEQIIDQTPKTP